MEPANGIQASLAPPRLRGEGFYSPQLDGLRFIAAFLVFIHHAPRLPYFGLIKDYGWAGVDLFLSISAFLITRLILMEHKVTGSFSFRSFFVRRALRIWPLYLSYATAMCLLTLGLRRLSAADTAAWWFSHLSFTNNVMTALQGYSPVLFSDHLWTISLEEQAYLLMPLLLSAFVLSGARPRSAVQFCLSAVGVLIIARLGFVLARAPHPFVWVLPLRGDAFFLGALAAIVLRDPLQIPSAALASIGLALVGSVILFPTIDKPSLYQIIGYTIVALGCTFLITATQGKSAMNGFLGSAPMRYLGKRSYGFYVYHLVALNLVLGRVHHYGLGEWIAVPVGLVLTAAMSVASYRILERPFLLMKERHTRVWSRPI